MIDPKSILVMNAGSSSIKFSIFSGSLDLTLHGELEGIGTLPHLTVKGADRTILVDQQWHDGNDSNAHILTERLMNWLEESLGGDNLAAIGHRVAIGGLEHSNHAIVTPALLERLKTLIPLAPLHQPRNLEPIESLNKSHPDIPQIVCFDTAFHRTLPQVAQLYGLPKNMRDAGAHRYGFHGLSYEYIARQLPTIDARAAKGKTIVAHLGSGASLCAMVDGKSVATTMGFSPLSGLVMGTRPGDLDAGLMIWMLREKGMSIDEVEHMLYHDAGLKGVSGISNDMRDLLISSAPEAAQAVDLFTYKISTEIGALTAAMGGLDALVFTAGIGENSAAIRQLICERAKWLGIEINDTANQQNITRINTDSSKASVLVMPTNEELMVARHTKALIENISAKSVRTNLKEHVL